MSEKISYCKLRMALPTRENLSRKYDWDEEQYQMILRMSVEGCRRNSYKETPVPHDDSIPRLYPRPVKGICGDTVYYVLRHGEYTPLIAFLYDAVDLRDESVKKNIGCLQVQGVFAENFSVRPTDLVYIRDGVQLSLNLLDWLLRKTKNIPELVLEKTRLSDIFTEENAKYNNGYWVEAYYDANGLLINCEWREQEWQKR